MSTYAKMLEDMQSAMLESEPDKIIPNLKNNRPSLEKRLNVYFVGYFMRLVQAVLSDYPTLIHYLGHAEVERLAISYVEQTPSNSYTLDVYSLEFAEYLSRNCEDHFAISLAKLESAIAEVFWLPDSESFTPSSDVTPEQFMELCFSPRKASKLIHLEYPVEEYTGAVREEKIASASEEKSNHMFIVRHNNEVKRHVLGYSEQIILSKLFFGFSIEAVLDEVTDKYPELIPDIEKNLQFWFASWIANGFFTI